MKCKKCGANIEEKSNLCVYCMNKLEKENNPKKEVNNSLENKRHISKGEEVLDKTVRTEPIKNNQNLNIISVDDKFQSQILNNEVDLKITNQDENINMSQNNINNKKSIKIIGLLLLLIAIFFIFLFKNNNLTKINIVDNELWLNCNDFSITKGSTLYLKAEVSPNKDAPLIWESSNPNVLTVDNGYIQALNLGEIIITVKIANSDISKNCKINVVEETIEISKLEINSDKLTMFMDEKYILKVTIMPSNASNKNLIWESSNENVVEVNSGVITAVGVGNATVTAKSYDGTKSVKTQINVVKKSSENETIVNKNDNDKVEQEDKNDQIEETIPISTISLDVSNITMDINQTKNLKAIITPTNATNKTLTWESSNENVVKVNNGLVTAVAPGTANIIVKTTNGRQAVCNVVVNERDRIHFIANGSAFTDFINGSISEAPSPSETILLESNGKYALIDTGLSNNNSSNPNRATYVVNYLKKLGVKNLEFILITHVHYDHMGGASYIIDNISTKKLYTKVYYGNDKSSQEQKTNNFNRYNKLYNKAKDMGIFEKINANDEGRTLSLGNMQIKLYGTKNLLYYNECYNEDENSNSIITYIAINGKKIFLTGDMEQVSDNCLKKFNSSCNGKSITECVVNKNSINNIDLLKLPHHGYSSCDINNNIISRLNTKNIVIQNWSSKVNYYYKGIQNTSGQTIGPIYSGLKSCRAQYFLDYETSGDNRRAYYVNNKNIVFDFTKSYINVYNN